MAEVLSQPQYLAALPTESSITKQRFLCSSYDEADRGIAFSTLALKYMW